MPVVTGTALIEAYMQAVMAATPIRSPLHRSSKATTHQFRSVAFGTVPSCRNGSSTKMNAPPVMASLVKRTSISGLVETVEALDILTTTSTFATA
jgi:hypothetical protein